MAKASEKEGKDKSPEKSVVDYIKHELSKGLKKKQIEKALLGAGWSSKKVNDAFDYVETSGGEKEKTVHSEKDEKFSFKSLFDKAKEVIASPRDFFESVKDETIKPVLIFHAIFLSVPYILLFILLTVLNSEGLTVTEYFSSFGIFLLLLLANYLGTFIYGFIVFLLTKIFDRTASYKDVMKAVAYPFFISIIIISITVGITSLLSAFTDVSDGLVLFFQIINTVAVTYTLLLQGFGLSKLFSLEWWKSTIIMLVVVAIQIGILFLLLQTGNLVV